VRYYANPCSDNVREAMRAGLIGFIKTPIQGNKLLPGVDWCADNGCFSSKWNEEKWWQWLTNQPRTMRFAVVPDVVADHAKTLELYKKWGPLMTEAEIPCAFVAQDGAVPDEIPWENIASVFIGGSTEWKLSPYSAAIVQRANILNIWAHVGRVNSYKRLRYARDIGANSVDGTYLTFGPDTNLPKLLTWLRRLEQETPLEVERGEYETFGTITTHEAASENV